jgi:hypothetical protein
VAESSYGLCQQARALLVDEFDNKVHELVAVNVLHTSLLNITVVAFKVFTLRSHTPMLAPIPLFETIFKLVLWNGFQSYRHITPDAINVIKKPSGEYGGCSNTVVCLLGKNSLIDSAL